ncbi:MAG TPA: RHS repeat-associated core domain-containing protein [Solirubrobacterales bacterium]
MRLLKTFGLATLTAVAALAFVGATSASATNTQLCTLHTGLGCLSAATSTHAVLATGTVGKLLNSFVTVLCLGVLVETEALGLGSPQQVHATTQSFTGCGTGSAHTNCTVTVQELPLSNLLKTGLDEGALTATNGRIRLVCSNLGIDCVYDLAGAEFAVGANHLTANETEITELGGKFLCPNEGFLDGLLEALTATYVTGSGGAEFPAEEQWGECNLAQMGMPRCLTGDPINAANGNLTEEQTDIAPLGGRGPALGITRSYNSQLAVAQETAGPFGYGWTGPYSAHLVIDEEAEPPTATVHQDNGSTAVFYPVGGKYTAPAWNQATLVKEGENYLFTLPAQEELEFNKSGLLTKVSDRHGLSLTLTYKEGKLETVEDEAERALTFAYKEGKVESVEDPLGGTVEYTYESGDLATVTLPGEEEPNWEFDYDGSHRLTERTDGRGNTTENEYDGSDRVILQIDPREGERELKYSAGETTITEPNGAKTLHKFNAAGEPTETVKAQGTELAQTTKYEYDASFRLVKLTDANNHATTYGYDAESNKTSEKDANGNEAKWTYNSTHDVLTETTPRGNTTTITRNAAGDAESIKRPAPGEKTQETKFKWAANGDLEESTDPLSRKTTFEYDENGNLEAETNPAGDERTFEYDENGRLISTVSPRGNEEGAEAAEFETETKRDDQGRPEVVTDPLGHETKRKYDAAGNLEVLTNPNGHATTYVYDEANQRTEVKAANGNTTKTAYDSMGQVKSKTDGRGKTTEYKRNLLGQLTETVDPLERKTTKKYDDAGNLEELKDAKGRTTTYTYDAGDRLEKVNFSEEATADVTYKYDKDGNVTEIKDGTGTTEKAYDILGRLTEVENGNEELIKYEYDLGNQITKITYPNGKTVTRGFDNAGRLEKVTDWLGKETKFAYNRDSALETATFPSASENKDEYEYNPAGELTKTTMKRASETLASISYARDNMGLLKSATQTGLPGAEKPEYEYDERERLKKGAGTSFEYDAANNPTKLGATTLKYDNASQLEEAGTTEYAYDEVGQRTEANPASGPSTTYGYDQAGNLTSVDRAEEGEVAKIEDDYAYDGTGLRSSQTISGVKAQFAWDVSEKLPLLLHDGTSYYLYGPGGLPFEQISSETATYLHHDHLGSTRLITNASGEAKGKYTYTPYGAVAEHTGTATTQLGFGGQYRNQSTGLIYLRARVYDPVTAQFLSVDPLVMQTGEAYSYAGDDPVNRGDPSGLAVTGWCGVGSVSVPFGSFTLTVCRVWNDQGKGALTLSLGGTLGQNLEAIKNLEKWIFAQSFKGLLKLLGNSWCVAGARFTSNAVTWDDLRGASLIHASGSFGYFIAGIYEYARSVENPNIYTEIYGLGGGMGWQLSATGGGQFTWVREDGP